MSDRAAAPGVAEPTPPWGVHAFGLDTNVLARIVLGDDVTQARIALATIETAIAERRPVLVTPTVWLELEWVLRSRAQLDRETIASVFDAILDTEGFVFPAWPAIEQALAWYRDDGADFADALHAALYAADGARLLTFDRAAARLPGAVGLGG